MKKLFFITVCGLIACFANASIDSTRYWKPSIPNKVQEEFTAPELETFSGLLNEHVYINLNKRLLQIDSAILLSGFVHRPGSQTWIGEHVGKFLFSASKTYAYTHDERIKALMDDMVRKYIATQLPDGYLGTYLPKDYWTEWDVWAHKYAIIGLLNYYSVTGNTGALETAKRAANLICRTFGNAPGQLDLNKAGDHVGLAPGSILEPMVDLYRYTGDKRYITFARYILKNWETSTGPKILTNLRKYNSNVTTVGDAKAYEMLSCFVGILKYYKLTGDTTYVRLLQNAWQDIVDKRLYITGTASVGEVFTPDHQLPAENSNHMGEGCVTVTWIQFNEQLLKITGELKYAEEIEKAVYNHLFAAENPETGCVSYYTALQGAKPYRCDQGYSCCLSSIPRGISMVPGLIWGQVNNVFTVLMYEPGAVKEAITAEDGSTLVLQVKAETNFPENGAVTYTVNPSKAKKFSLRFRIPSWAVNYKIAVNGVEQVTAKDEAGISREWHDNDKVKVRFDMPVQVINGGPSYPGHIAFKRGPQVLAVDSALNAGHEKALPVYFGGNTNYTLADVGSLLPKYWVGRQAYTITTGGDKTKQLVLVPFADAGQGASPLQVWVPYTNTAVAER